MHSTHTLGRWSRQFAGVIVVGFITSALYADRVELKSGEVFIGDILRADADEVSIKLQAGGTISFPMERVEFFRRNFVASTDWDSDEESEDSDSGDVEKESEPVEDLVDPVATWTPFAEENVKQQAETDEHEARKVDPLNPKLVESSVQNQQHGFDLAPPKGFLVWPGDKNSASIAYYRDPVSGANLNVLAASSSESIETIKMGVTRTYREDVFNFRVVRDERLWKVPYDGWLLEVKSELGSDVIHQLQVYAMDKKRVVILTYSTLENGFAALSKSFEESIRSFRFREKQTEKSAAVEETIPEVDTAVEPGTSGTVSVDGDAVGFHFGQ